MHPFDFSLLFNIFNLESKLKFVYNINLINFYAILILTTFVTFSEKFSNQKVQYPLLQQQILPHSISRFVLNLTLFLISVKQAWNMFQNHIVSFIIFTIKFADINIMLFRFVPHLFEFSFKLLNFGFFFGISFLAKTFTKNTVS